MQIVSYEDNLQEVSDPIFQKKKKKKKNIIRLSSAEVDVSCMETVKASSKICSRHPIVFFCCCFFRENKLAFHVNHLTSR